MNRQVTVAEVTGEGFLRNSQNTVIRGLVLVLKKSDWPLQLFRPQATKLKRPLPEGTYDRMAIIGQWNSKDCFVVISASAQKSAKLFSDRHLTVGSVVEVTEPIYSNTCLGNDRNNPIIETHQAIVVINTVTNEDFPPIPITSLPSTPAMFHYTLNSRNLLFLHGNIISPTCSGTMCDRRILRSETVCACLQKNSVSSWTVAARIISRDVEEEADDPLSGDMTQSHQLASFFCSNDVLRLPASSVELNLLRESMTRVTAYVNDNGGWRISGYSKSSVSDESITQAVHHVRICRLMPASVIPNNLKYTIGYARQPPNRPPPLQHANPNVQHD